MGEKQYQPFQLSFNASLRVDFQGSRVTSDGGLVLVRELDERLRFGELIEQHLTDSRRGKNSQLALADLLRKSIYSQLAGYEDVNDAERLSQDSTFRLISSDRIGDRGAALTSRLQTFETEILTEEGNFAGLAPLLVHTIFSAIDEINKEGTTILLVEQNANAALKHAHRGYVLETGCVVMEGPSRQLAADSRVKEAYLGER
ncbi:MAG: hypothetical protein A3F68_01845 [Acidobacteria bacterium RIFCSPLOWO2_12_FULL_54_10]|nr:MAG: hypothetical protein A3F68_01845 [Acidobacteria bacterium RIFCSPLOWO2_12_FULL_54_10]